MKPAGFALLPVFAGLCCRFAPAAPASFGDIVAWRLCPGVTHIGIVVDEDMVVHNIGAGPRCEDVLFAYEPIDHFRPARASLRY